MCIRDRWEHLRRIGFINFLPNFMQSLLLHRSIFDVLCDIWFSNKILIIVRTLVRPFFVKVRPEEAISYLDDLDRGMRRKLITKGVLNIFPKGVKTLMMPAGDSSPEINGVLRTPKREPINDENSNAESLSGEDNGEMKQGRRRSFNLEESTARPPSEEFQSDEAQPQSNRGNPIWDRVFPSASQMNPFSLSSLIDSRPTQRSGEKTPQRQMKRITSLIRFKDEQPAPKSQVIMSSKQLYGRKKEAPISAKWDNLENFKRSLLESQLYKQPRAPGATQKATMVGPLKILQQLTELKDKLHLTRIESKTILKTFAVSSLPVSYTHLTLPTIYSV
eukprot:TRINITY_DN12971_c0_g1_i2.p1 TRINITY_DN12971_c0_g1~~TRINITY_DN12971_c0_g1_i2.p1  ORF type:complete len:352 (-),score=81.70 TRINITY_DN12971_c0_g1_i2:34-1032(-)